MGHKLIFDFDNAETRDGFIKWFLDGAGDQDYWNAMDHINNLSNREKIPTARFEGWAAGCPKELEEIIIQSPTMENEEI